MENIRVILDLRGLVIHSFYSGQPEDTVPNAKGERVPSAAHGVKRFIDMYLQPLLQRYAPIQIIGVTEGGNQRRRALLADYKNKPTQDSEDLVLTMQRDLAFDAVQKLLIGIGALLVKTPSVEADDTIAYLVQRLHGGKLVYTVDADLLQLHSGKCKIILKNEFTSSYKGMDLEEGVPSSMVAMHKSIVGDPSDGYVGVRGMGQGAWDKLVSTYGYDGLLQLEQCVKTNNYDMIEESLAESPDKTLQKLYDARHEWRLSYVLACLHPEWCELSYQNKVVRPQWAKRVPTKERIMKVLEPLGLETYASIFSKFWVKKQPIDANTVASKPNFVSNVVRHMQASPLVAFDYESYDYLKHPAYRQARAGYVDVLSQKITGCSFAFGDNLQYCGYFSFKHRDTANLSLEVLKELLQGLEDTRGYIVAHNATFENAVTQLNLNQRIKKTVLDTRVMSSYVDENLPDGLKELSQYYLNYKQIRYDEVVPRDGDMRDVSLLEVLDYGCDDSICTAHMFVLFKIIMECEGSWKFYEENEPYFDEVTLKTFLKGIPVDFDRLTELRNEDEAVRDKTVSELRQLLREHCSQVNEAGFNLLWGELETYFRSSLGEKVKENKMSEEDLELTIAEKREETYFACRYRELSPPELNWKKASSISKIARLLGFPGIRSIKSTWLQAYVSGMREQAAEQQYTMTECQSEFLLLLEGAGPYLTYGLGEEFEKLAQFCQQLLASDTSLWEGDELNIDSPKQMAELFYGKMGLPVLMRNIDKTGDNKRTLWEMEQAPSTSVLAIETWLAEINNEEDWRYKVLKAVLTLRGISTRFKLYYTPYPLLQSPQDGRIHPSLKNCGTQTRRPTCSTPNILQVSKKDEGKLRSAFIPMDEKSVIVSIDFVQQELVILAGLSDDSNLRSCYQGSNRRDVHSLTGTAILNVQRSRKGIKPVSYEDFKGMIENKDKEATAIRKKPAKITNFLTVYGGSASGLSRKAVVPRAMAEEFLNAFFSTYPGVATYQEKMVTDARRHGFVETCFGTRKHCTEIFNKNNAIASSWERQAVNHPIQGGAADVLKVVMRKIVETSLLEETGADIYAPVYDEIVASVPIVNVVEYCNRMADIMEMELPGLGIKLETSVSIGKNWGDQIEIGTRPTAEVIQKTLDKIFNLKEEENAVPA